MNQTAPSSSRPIQRKWRRCLLLTVLLLIVLAGGGILWFFWFSARELAALTAEMDQLDPGWRLHEIEARRRVVPDSQNSARHILAIKALHGGQSVSTPAMEKLFDNLPPQVQLNEQQVAYLDKRLDTLKKAVLEARRLKDMPYGRYPIQYAADFYNTIINCQDARLAYDLLQWDAARRAQEGDGDGAVESCLALQHAARSIGDEPFLISQLVRYAGNAIAIVALERTLAQSQFTAASEPCLERMQAALARELADPTLLMGLRGERAGAHDLFQGLAEGKINAKSLGALFGGNAAVANALGHIPGYLTTQHAALLRFHNQLVNAAKLPPEEKDKQFEALEKKVRDEPLLVRLIAPATAKVREAERRTQAGLATAMAAVAAERFRIAQERWPDSLEHLVKAGFLDAVPLDPYDGKPIRCRRTADGFVVYSVGQDKIDNGGMIDRDRPTHSGTDTGLRLWDVARRRLRPNPPVPVDDPQK